MSFCVRYVSAVNPAGSKFAANDQKKKATKKWEERTNMQSDLERKLRVCVQEKKCV